MVFRHTSDIINERTDFVESRVCPTCDSKLRAIIRGMVEHPNDLGAWRIEGYCPSCDIVYDSDSVEELVEIGLPYHRWATL